MLDSRSYFFMVHQASQRIEEMQRIISSGGEEYQARHSASGSRPGHSDPTAAAAIRNGAVMEWAQRERDAACETVGDALEVLAGVEIGLGRTYADVLEFRYIDGFSWGEVCMLVGVSRTTAYRHITAAHNWIDSQGIERVRMMAKGV